MFALKSILEFLILPPVNLLLGLVLGLVLLRSRPCLARRLLFACTGLLLLFSMPAVGDTLLVALEQGLPLTPPAGDPPQAIVILGAEVRKMVEPPGYEIGPLGLQRVAAGAALYRKTHLPILVTGGVLGTREPAVSVLMAKTLQQSFDVTARWVEPRSLDTWQNAMDSAAILRRNGIHSVYVVTHGWHERRALIAFRAAGLTATAAPTSLEKFPDFLPEDFVPTVSVWLTSYYAVHEWVGCAWYALH